MCIIHSRIEPLLEDKVLSCKDTVQEYIADIESSMVAIETVFGEIMHILTYIEACMICFL